MNTLILNVLTAFLFTTTVFSQTADVDLDRLSDVVDASISNEMAGWTCRRGDPIQGSQNVLVKSCLSGDNVVKISIVPFATSELARTRLRQFVSLGKSGENVSDLGDEAYSWGFKKSKFAFRKGRLNVYVSIADPQQPDAARISKQLARAVAKSLNDF